MNVASAGLPSWSSTHSNCSLTIYNTNSKDSNTTSIIYKLNIIFTDSAAVRVDFCGWTSPVRDFPVEAGAVTRLFSVAVAQVPVELPLRTKIEWKKKFRFRVNPRALGVYTTLVFNPVKKWYTVNKWSHPVVQCCSRAGTRRASSTRRTTKKSRKTVKDRYIERSVCIQQLRKQTVHSKDSEESRMFSVAVAQVPVELPLQKMRKG